MQPELAKCAVLLAFAKDGFDQLANDLTRGIAGMANGARIALPDREDMKTLTERQPQFYRSSFDELTDR